MILVGQPDLDLLFTTAHFTPAVEASELLRRRLTPDSCSSDSASLMTMCSLKLFLCFTAFSVLPSTSTG